MWKKKCAHLCLYPILWLVTFLVSLRYRLVIKGLDKIKAQAFPRPGGILFLPNHPAEIDPVILELVLWRAFKPRPLIVEHFYNLKGFKFFMDLVDAMPLPSMDLLANRWRGKKVKQQFENVVEALKNKRNFLIYPSGRLKLTGMELLGGASFIHNLLQECPEANVVFIRTTGLWGSKFSKALTGASPDFGKVLWECTKILLKNGIFFAPKREVLIELELPPADFPQSSVSRLEFNKYLENWYNRYPEAGPEPVKLVSYASWKEDLPQVYVSAEPERQVAERAVPKKIEQEVIAHLSAVSGHKPEQIERKMHLSYDLGLDSLDVAELYVFLDQKYEMTHLRPGDLQTVEDLMQAAAGYKEQKEDAPAQEKQRFAWPKEERLAPQIADGNTLQEVFLRSVERNGSTVACVDRISGALTYRKLKLAALILADKIKQMPGERIGIMLPSSVGANVAIFAVLLAGKVPVMINWTAGVKALDHCMDLAELQTVITSSKFLDRLDNEGLGKMEDRLQFIEEIRPTISWKDKLRGLFLSFRGVDSLLKKLQLSELSSFDSAVILFTSGTESLPKGVPLSHFNLLSNQRACLQAVQMHATDILYGVLPPFHSFGFSVTGILGLLAGLRMCYAPDPTDSHGMARDSEEWKPTLLCCAPSFIRALFRVAKPEQLVSYRLIVAGAEKTPQELFDYVHEHLPEASLLEGYGITECSPVVTFDRVGEPHQGVGRPLPGIEIIAFDRETHQALPTGKEGELGIIGPSVFDGYLGNPRDPFILINGKRWYASGDRGYLSPEGHLILVGRLKRFVKIGGEMVSLGGLEEELLKLAKEKQWVSGKEEGPPLAVSVREKETDKPLIILFTTFTISKEDVNSALKECGYGRIVKVAEVRTLEQIPLTGTGKTHYRLLDETTSQ